MIKNSFSYAFSLALVIADFLAVLSAFVLAYILRVEIDDRPLVVDIPAREFLYAFLVLVPIWLIIFASLGLYRQEVYEKRVKATAKLLFGAALGMLFIIAYDWGVDEEIFPARLVPIYAFALAAGLLMFERAVMTLIRRRLFNYGFGVKNVLLVGNNDSTREIGDLIKDTNSSGYRVIGVTASKQFQPNIKGLKVLSSPKQAIKFMHKQPVHVVIQTERYEDQAVTRDLIDAAQAQHIVYKFVPSEQTILANKISVELLANVPVVSVYQTPLVGWGRTAKRLFDIFASILGILVLLPAYIVIGIIVKITDPKGPIFYKHARVSRFGTTFYAYKLRSMYWKYSTGGKKTDEEVFKDMGREDLIEEWRQNQKLENDPRIMPIGKFTRKTSLDEIPQLWNVLKGDLSLIGPRPVTKEELKRYAESSALFLSVKPGVSGLWQVSGRNDTTYDERIALDLYYIQNWSFLLDLKIIYRTVLIMVKGKGQ